MRSTEIKHEIIEFIKENKQADDLIFQLTLYLENLIDSAKREARKEIKENNHEFVKEITQEVLGSIQITLNTKQL